MVSIAFLKCQIEETTLMCSIHWIFRLFIDLIAWKTEYIVCNIFKWCVKSMQAKRKWISLILDLAHFRQLTSIWTLKRPTLCRALLFSSSASRKCKYSNMICCFCSFYIFTISHNIPFGFQSFKFHHSIIWNNWWNECDVTER